MHLKDSRTHYGWISIALHWTGAIAVAMLWLIGHVMTSERTGESEHAELVRVHTSVAVTVYALLVARVAHRLATGFPEPVESQTTVWSLLTRLVQYALLAGIVVMLVSGPLMVWANGDTIGVFDWRDIPSPFPPHAGLHELMAQAHRTTRWALLAIVLTHVGMVFLGRAETLNRMLLAPEKPPPGPP